MEISQIAFIEDGNFNCIHMYKEGSFWKAYEHSAYMFVKHIKSYRVKLHYYKNIKRELISIGFPDIVLASIIEGKKTPIRKDKEISIELNEVLEERDFQDWKDNCAKSIKNVQIPGDMYQVIQMFEGDAKDSYKQLLVAIRTFPLMNSTPMECMQFISELQKTLVIGS